MKKTNVYNIETIIIGGGLSGLFFCSGLIKRKYRSFLLIEQNEELGGYALRGNMKIGLLPAGNRTKKLLEPGIYEYYQDKFIEIYKKYLTHTKSELLTLNYKSVGLQNKFYNSFILERASALEIIEQILEQINHSVLYQKILSITALKDCFEICFNDSSILRCKYLIIASGRSHSMISVLENLGQGYSKDHDLLVGCRGTFDSKESDKLFRYQADFKIKDSNSAYQTYCFNYRGDLQKYNYKNKNIYSGTLNEKRSSGNCFIGKRIRADPEAILCEFEKSFKISSRDLEKRLMQEPLEKYFQDMGLFVEKLRILTGLKFKNFYFPALEQFWPRPHINSRSLESKELANIFYIGDASGMSFGVLQCYITANILLSELEKRHVFH